MDNTATYLAVLARIMQEDRAETVAEIGRASCRERV